MSISFVLITFLAQLAVGMTATVSVLPVGLVDKRFFKTVSFLSALFVAISLYTRYYATFKLPEVFGGGSGMTFLSAPAVLLGFFGLLSLFLWGRIQLRDIRVSQIELLGITAVGFAALVVDSLHFRPALPPFWIQSILLPLHFVSASLLLGGFLSGMIFGHYYLVSTEMPKRLLSIMAWILIGILLFRIAAVGMTLLLYKEIIRPGVDFLTTLTSFQGHGIFFWERVLVGLLIPSIVAVMIWRTARIGSNQSATGIMYVAIAFVFIGELAARYLFLISAIPL